MRDVKIRDFNTGLPLLFAKKNQGHFKVFKVPFLAFSRSPPIKFKVISQISLIFQGFQKKNQGHFKVFKVFSRSPASVSIRVVALFVS